MTTPDSAAARMARKQRKRERSRDDILAAAREVLLRSGIAAVTLEAVAREAGMSKTGLYYYFASKEALVFELVFDALQGHAEKVKASVEQAKSGTDALSAVIRETIGAYAPQMDDFRLAYLLGQVSSGLQMAPEQFERIRPLNDMLLSGAARMVAGEGTKGLVEPRLLTFLALVSAIGVLTMKGLVESQGDPLIYSDAQMIDALGRIFSSAATSN